MEPQRVLEPRSAPEPLRVLELYSGIGGMHFALKACGVPAQVVAAVDINTTANRIYQHNFPHTPLWSRTIEGVPLQDFCQLSVDVIVMSPPCQPFTRLGLKRDVVDPRTRSFLYLLELLPQLRPAPRYLLLENVKGFEESLARQQLVKVLTECGFKFKEMLVSPTSVGIPNSRLRYFLMARRSEEGFSQQTSSQILEMFGVSQGGAEVLELEQTLLSETKHTQTEHTQTEHTQTEHTQTEHTQTEHTQTEHTQTEHTQTEQTQTEHTQTEHTQTEHTQTEHTQTEHTQTEQTQMEHTQTEHTQTEQTQMNQMQTQSGQFLFKLETQAQQQRKQEQNSDSSIRQISDFLDVELDLDQYLLPPRTLLRYAYILDIVRPGCRRSVCFTKGYGRYVEGTGSVLQSEATVRLEDVFRGLQELQEEERLRTLQTLRLRYFTPREVANLMGFPQSFSFPHDVPLKQRYKVLGNSLNVLVVSRLLQVLLSDRDHLTV